MDWEQIERQIALSTNVPQWSPQVLHKSSLWPTNSQASVAKDMVQSLNGGSHQRQFPVPETTNYPLGPIPITQFNSCRATTATGWSSPMSTISPSSTFDCSSSDDQCSPSQSFFMDRATRSNHFNANRRLHNGDNCNLKQNEAESNRFEGYITRYPEPIVDELDRWLSIFNNSITPTVSMKRSVVLLFLRRLKNFHQHKLEANLALCVFCRNNNEPYEMYISHKVKDCYGRVVCPVLRRYTCPLCGLTGDHAHTIKHCPKSSSSTSDAACPVRKRSHIT